MKAALSFLLLILLSATAQAQIITTVAGSSVYGGAFPPIGDGGPATEAIINDSYGIAADDSGNIYFTQLHSIAATTASVVRKINREGVVTTIAGYYSGLSYIAPSGPDTNFLTGPSAVYIAHNGDIFITDAFGYCIRKIDTAGVFSLFAGTPGVFGYTGDGGPATLATLGFPRNIAEDRKGNIYIADNNNFCIRKVDTVGVITTIAGTGMPGHTGDGGPAILAAFVPLYLTLDDTGNIYIDDEYIYIRKIDTFGIITTIAGNGIPGYGGDGGPAMAASMNCTGLAIDSLGNIYLGDGDNNRVRKINTAGIITTIAGTGIGGFSGDGGPADSAQVYQVLDIALDHKGHIYFTDHSNGRIREITDTPQYANIATNVGSTACSGTPVIFTAHAIDTTAYHYLWQRNGATAGGDSATYTTSSLATGDTIKCFFLSPSGTVLDTSNTITMIIVPSFVPSVSIAAVSDTVCAGAAALFTVTGVYYGGTSPALLWQLNSVAQASGNAFSYTPSDGDTITCLLTSMATCAIPPVVTSNAIIMSVQALPVAGIINGPSSVCVGSAIFLSDAVAGGLWACGTAGVAVSSGTVTGLLPGTDVVTYSVTTACGSATAIKVITVHPLPFAGGITGPSSVCADSFIVVTDTAVGGAWVSRGPAAIIYGAATATVTGTGAGTDTLLYLVSNSCGTDSAARIITVYAAPSAGGITGPALVCAGSSVTVADTVSGGTWAISNASAIISGTSITGVFPGTDTVSYTVTNACGTATAVKVVATVPLPFAGNITGAYTVCAGAAITLTDTASGGVWSSNNAIATLVPGTPTATVTAVGAGTDTLRYIVANSCGADSAVKVITVYPQPAAGIISGPAVVCAGSAITLADAATGGIWSSSNAHAAITTAGITTGSTAGTDTISYSVTNGCGTTATAYPITIAPQPYAAPVSGLVVLCEHATAGFTDSAAGGVWSSDHSGTATVSDGTVTAIAAGTDSIRYTVTNSCGTAIAAAPLTVIAGPAVPLITTHPDGSLCTGTMFQNFGTGTAPAVGISYAWSAANAQISVQSASRQYALVSFNTPGSAAVILTANDAATGCSSADTFAATVSSAAVPDPLVVYYTNDLACLDNTADSYQWGVDDKTTLDSTIIPGAADQDYLLTAPDFGDKYYWVITTYGGCMQKSYYNAPVSVPAIATGTDIQLYPDPADAQINIAIHGITPADAISIKMYNMLGKAVYTGNITNGAGSIGLSAMAPGIYTIAFSKNGIPAGARMFVKK